MAKFLFWILTAVYLSLYVTKVSGNYIPMVSDYLADLLCLPLVLSFCRFVMIQWRFVPRKFELSRAMIFATTVYIAVVFEGILPVYGTAYESDLLDIVAYFLGAIGYYFFREKQKINQHEFSETER